MKNLIHFAIAFTLGMLVAQENIHVQAVMKNNDIARSLPPKWKSIHAAFDALSNWSPQETDELCETLRTSDDVDFLRTIAMASEGAAWPMNAGCSSLDNPLDDLFMVATKRLCELPTQKADDARWLLFHGFALDGCVSGMVFETLQEMQRRFPEAPNRLEHSAMPPDSPKLRDSP